MVTQEDKKCRQPGTHTTFTGFDNVHNDKGVEH